MTSDKSKLTHLKSYEEGNVVNVDNAKGKITDISFISKKSITLDNMFYVYGLKNNLISIIYLCDKGLNMEFYTSFWVIRNKANIFLVSHKHKNIYVIDFVNSYDSNFKLLYFTYDDVWLWYK